MIIGGFLKSEEFKLHMKHKRTFWFYTKLNRYLLGIARSMTYSEMK
jgi:hypothetical protein